jgi:hypothetical protein
MADLNWFGGRVQIILILKKCPLLHVDIPIKVILILLMKLGYLGRKKSNKVPTSANCFVTSTLWINFNNAPGITDRVRLYQ